MGKTSQSFEWKRFPEWKNFIWGLFPKTVQTGLYEAIRNKKEGFEYVNGIYFEEFYAGGFGDYSALVKSFCERFSEQFRFVKMYHCCRPSDTQSYYDSGIRVLDANDVNEKFKKLFLGNTKFPQITESHIQAAIDHMADSHGRAGLIYFGLDDRFLLEHCGHYLIYGSEYLQGLATSIQREFGYELKAELRKSGKPTVFEVQMPVEDFSEDELWALAEQVFPTWAYNIAHNKDSSYALDFCIQIDHGLPADLIVRHYHPETIPNASRYY